MDSALLPRRGWNGYLTNGNGTCDGIIGFYMDNYVSKCSSPLTLIAFVDTVRSIVSVTL